VTAGRDLEPTSERDFLAKAANGDTHALNTLSLYTLAGDAADTPLGELVAQAEIFARLACEVGGVDELGLLLEVVWFRSVLLADVAPRRSEQLTNQAALILEELERTPEGRAVAAAALTGLADAGNEAAALRLNQLLEKVSASEAASIRPAVAERHKAGGELAALLRKYRDAGQ
jgi:hypothetical protein